MNRDQVEGKTEELKGKAKEAIGNVTGNQDLKDEGQADQVVGKTQKTYGDAKETVGKAVEDLGKEIKK